ncbi:MAG: glycoside hydrolase family 10 protein, partial [Anaerolineae bacterium]
MHTLRMLLVAVFLVTFALNLFLWSVQQPSEAVDIPLAPTITNTLFDESLWAVLGHEAWYVERGYLHAPPACLYTATPITPMPSAGRIIANVNQHYLPIVFQGTIQRLTPTATPTPTLLPTATSIPTVSPPDVEARAIWVTRFDWTCVFAECPDGQLPGTDTIQQMVANIDSAGFNMILFQVRAQGDAYYTPGLEPWAARLTGTYTATLGQNPGWDPLAVLIAAAHARGIQVHAYFNVYPIWSGTSAPPDGTRPLHPFWAWSRAPGSSWSYWRQWNINYQPMLLNAHYLWASPGNDWLVEEHIVATALDLLHRYDLDGLHLDLVRYAGADYSCDPRSEERWGAPCFTNGDYADWQRAQITHLVSRIYHEGILPLSRHTMLSAAVWWFPQDLWGMGCSGGYDRYYQDSHGWLSAGMIDAEMPMLYGCPAFTSGSVGDGNWIIVMRDWLEHRADRYVFPGISADMDWSSIETRINAERAEAISVGAIPGHAIFSYGVIQARNYWAAFASGPYRQRAT